MTKGKVAYKRNKFGISIRNKVYQEFVEQNSELFEKLNSDSKERLFKRENIDAISKAITHFAFRNGPIENMHANNQLSENDMKTLNKYIVNRIAGLLTAIADNNWLQLELLLSYYRLYGTELTVAEYIDHQNYACIIARVCENFDESLEYYDPLTWMALTKEEIKGDSLSIKVVKALGKTEDYLNELSQRSEKKCRTVLKMILEQSAEFQRAVWGKAYLFTEDLLDEVFEDCIEIQDTYTMEESRDAFVKILDRHLSVIE